MCMTESITGTSTSTPTTVASAGRHAFAPGPHQHARDIEAGFLSERREGGKDGCFFHISTIVEARSPVNTKTRHVAAGGGDEVKCCTYQVAFQMLTEYQTAVLTGREAHTEPLPCLCSTARLQPAVGPVQKLMIEPEETRVHFGTADANRNRPNSCKASTCDALAANPDPA
jgi:hypothetical protein